ncbi:hypothetical protein M0R45_031944 [Rubus argutus]|uniref:Uncharacterized protein n=1 Tax=Rubus argutus TaxID=59490 RepID=A0AAW1WG59_RUBAR
MSTDKALDTGTPAELTRHASPPTDGGAPLSPKQPLALPPGSHETKPGVPTTTSLPITPGYFLTRYWWHLAVPIPTPSGYPRVPPRARPLPRGSH